MSKYKLGANEYTVGELSSIRKELEATYSKFSKSHAEQVAAIEEIEKIERMHSKISNLISEFKKKDPYDKTLHENIAVYNNSIAMVRGVNKLWDSI